MSNQPYNAKGSWPGLRGFAELAEEAALAKRLQAEVEALRGELEAKDKVLQRIVEIGDYYTSTIAENVLQDYRRKEDTNA